MKILITVGIYPPDIGVPVSFVPKIAKLLTDNNFDVTRDHNKSQQYDPDTGNYPSINKKPR